MFTYTAHKMKFSIKDFFSKGDQNSQKTEDYLSQLFKKSIMESPFFHQWCMLAKSKFPY